MYKNCFLILLSICMGGLCSYSGYSTFHSTPTVRKDYKFRLVDGNSVAAGLAGTATYWPAYYNIDIRVNPCSNSTLTGGRGSGCCSGTSEVNCQDHPEGVFAGQDLQVAYIQNAHISTCEGTDFADDPNCGTYLEIHRALTTVLTSLREEEFKVLADVRLTNTYGGYTTTYLRTNEHMCSGNYEIWWVVRTRSGPYVQLRKPFSVISPSCVT
jgi:hypothetical protein